LYRYNWWWKNYVTKLILSKVTQSKYFNPDTMDNNDSLIERKDILLPAPIDLEKEYDLKIGYFDFVAFWKKQYKELLGYR